MNTGGASAANSTNNGGMCPAGYFCPIGYWVLRNPLLLSTIIT